MTDQMIDTGRFRSARVSERQTASGP